MIEAAAARDLMETQGFIAMRRCLNCDVTRLVVDPAAVEEELAPHPDAILLINIVL